MKYKDVERRIENLPVDGKKITRVKKSSGVDPYLKVTIKDTEIYVDVVFISITRGKTQTVVLLKDIVKLEVKKISESMVDIVFDVIVCGIHLSFSVGAGITGYYPSTYGTCASYGRDISIQWMGYLKICSLMLEAMLYNSNIKQSIYDFNMMTHGLFINHQKVTSVYMKDKSSVEEVVQDIRDRLDEEDFSEVSRRAVSAYEEKAAFDIIDRRNSCVRK